MYLCGSKVGDVCEHYNQLCFVHMNIEINILYSLYNSIDDNVKIMVTHRKRQNLIELNRKSMMTTRSFSLKIFF